MATLGVFSWALLLQSFAGLLALTDPLERTLTPNAKTDRWHRRLTEIYRRKLHARFFVKYRDIYQMSLRQLSLLSLAVMGIVRLSSGQPLLNLF